MQAAPKRWINTNYNNTHLTIVGPVKYGKQEWYTECFKVQREVTTALHVLFNFRAKYKKQNIGSIAK